MNEKKLKLKVCGLRRPDDARALAALGLDYLGFIFVQSSPRFAPPEITPELIREISEKSTPVAVFQDQDLGEVSRIVTHYGFRAIQLHGGEDARYISMLRACFPGHRLIKAISVHSRSDVEQMTMSHYDVDFFILDGKQPGSGVPFAWEWLSCYELTTPFLLAGGVGATNVEEALRVSLQVPQCMGFDVNSGVEIAPGLKDLTKVMEVRKRVLT